MAGKALKDMTDAEIEQELSGGRGGPSSGGAQLQSLSFKPVQSMDDAEIEQELARIKAGAPEPSGVQLSGEVSNSREDGIIPGLERYPELITAPAVRSLSGLTAMLTNADANKVEKIMKANNPGLKVEDINGYKIYEFQGDPQKYKWAPGARWSDAVRAAPAMVAAALTAPASLPAAIGTNMAMAMGGQLAQGLAGGGDPEILPVALAGVLPAVVPGVRAGVSWAADKLGKFAKPLVQTVDDLAPRFMDQVRKLAPNWGVNPDVASLTHQLSNVRKPQVDMAQSAFNAATADAENAAASAASRMEAEKLASQVRLEDAAKAARLGSQAAKTTITNEAQDSLARVAAKTEEAVASAADPAKAVWADAEKTMRAWGASDHSSFDRKFLDGAYGRIEDSQIRSNAIGRELGKVMPATTPVPPGEVSAALEWIDGALAGTTDELQSTTLKTARAVLAKPDLQMGSLTKLRQEASDAGWKGMFANQSKGEGKTLANILMDAEVRVAETIPGGSMAGGLLDGPGPHTAADLAKAMRSEVSSRISYQNSLKRANIVRGAEALNKALRGSAVPAMDKAGKALQKGNMQAITDALDTAPKGMEKEMLANILYRAGMEGAPEDAVLAAKHFAKFVDTLQDNKVVAARVFGKLEPGARRELLDLGSRARSAAAQSADTVAAARGAQAEAKLMVGRQKASDLTNAGNVKADAALAAERAERATMQKVKLETTAAVKAAEGAKGAAKDALDNANALNINLSPAMKTASAGLVEGNLEPWTNMMKAVTPELKPIVASTTLYRGAIDAGGVGTEGISGFAKYMRQLTAGTRSKAKLFAELTPEARRGWSDTAVIADLLDRGTKGGQVKAVTFVEHLSKMGAWVSGKGGLMAGAGIGGATATAVGAPVVAGVAAGTGGGFVLGRMLVSGLGKNQSAETKLANAVLRAPATREILKRLSLDRELPQGLVRNFLNLGPMKTLIRTAGGDHGKFGQWLDRAGYVGSVGATRALSPNGTKENE